MIRLIPWILGVAVLACVLYLIKEYQVIKLIISFFHWI